MTMHMDSIGWKRLPSSFSIRGEEEGDSGMYPSNHFFPEEDEDDNGGRRRRQVVSSNTKMSKRKGNKRTNNNNNNKSSKLQRKTFGFLILIIIGLASNWVATRILNRILVGRHDDDLNNEQQRYNVYHSDSLTDDNEQNNDIHHLNYLQRENNIKEEEPAASIVKARQLVLGFLPFPAWAGDKRPGGAKRTGTKGGQVQGPSKAASCACGRVVSWMVGQVGVDR